MRSINDAIKAFRKLLMKITGLPNNYILNGESIRGAELVTFKNGQKIPFTADDTFIIHYIKPLEELNVIETLNSEDEDLIKTLQSYELHLVIYGNNSHDVITKIKSNIYTEYCNNYLRDNEISLMNITYIENTSDFKISQTYVLRYDMRVNFNVILETDKIETEQKYTGFEIKEVKIIWYKY